MDSTIKGFAPNPYNTKLVFSTWKLEKKKCLFIDRLKDSYCMFLHHKQIWSRLILNFCFKPVWPWGPPPPPEKQNQNNQKNPNPVLFSF